jgi:hypothetical protein
MGSVFAQDADQVNDRVAACDALRDGVVIADVSADRCAGV